MSRITKLLPNPIIPISACQIDCGKPNHCVIKFTKNHVENEYNFWYFVKLINHRCLCTFILSGFSCDTYIIWVPYGEIGWNFGEMRNGFDEVYGWNLTDMAMHDNFRIEFT